MKPLAYTVAALCLAVPHAAHAQSPFEFYGQINLGVFDFDDGTERQTKFLDNDNSNTRLGLWYRMDLSDGTKLQFNLEANLGLEKTDEVTIDDNDFDIDPKRTDFRHIEAIFDTPSYGKFYLGQGSMSADSITEFDFSGTGVITYVSITDLAGSIQFREKNLAPSTTTVGSGFGSLDGGRRLRARYDTPSFSGFSLSASYGEEWLDQSNDDDYTDIAVRYGGDHGDFKVAAGLGYQWIEKDNQSDEEIVAGSAAFLHIPTGLSLAFAGGSADESNAEYIYTKLGYQRKWFTWGSTNLSVDYYDGDDFNRKGSDSKSWSLAAVQNIDQHNIEVYAAYRNYDFDASGTNYEDVEVVAAGARWKF